MIFLWLLLWLPVKTKTHKKPLFSKVSSRGWENRTPTKGLETPIIPLTNPLQSILYILSKLHNMLTFPWELTSCVADWVLYSAGVTSWLRLSAFWSSPHPISNSQLHVLPHFHLCPIYLVVFKGVYFFRMGYLILRGASRLDAFSVYPFRAWLLGRRLGSLTDAPAARPSRSSRTKDSSSQISYAHAG